MKIKLTDAAVSSAHLQDGETDRTIWDTDVSGFGVRLRPSGKTWILSFRPRGAGRSASSKRMKLAAVDAMPRTQDARNLARVTLGQIAAGHDPLAQRREARRKEKAKVADLLDRYERDLTRRGYVNRSTVMADLRRRLQSHMSADIATLGGADFVAIIDRLDRAGKEGAAHGFRLRCSAFLSWCVASARVLERNPLAGYRKTRATRADRVTVSEHGRALSDQELARVWLAADGEANFDRLVRFLILTGCRRAEGAGLTHAMIDRKNRLIRFPAIFVKQGRDHMVPFDDPVDVVISSAPRDARSDFVFPSGRTGGPISGWSKLLPALRKRSGVEFALHDLRRTCRTGLSRLGVDEGIAELAIGHARGELEAIYNRDDALDRLRSAAELWTAHVLKAVEAEQARARGIFG